MPKAIGVHTARELDYGTVSLERRPLTGGPVRPYRFRFRDEAYSPFVGQNGRYRFAQRLDPNAINPQTHSACG